MKKLSLIVAAIAVLAIVAGCASSGGSTGGATATGSAKAKAEIVPLPPDPDLDIADIGNEWTLYLDRTLSVSWSDNDRFSLNPPADVAEGVENPNGGWDFTYTKYNQRVIFALTQKQIEKVKAAANVQVIIDGESSGTEKFRYHIGDSELGQNWNATASFDESPFSNILDRTIRLSDKSNVKVFMIQSRGKQTRDAFPPEVVTIRSIKFICK